MTAFDQAAADVSGDLPTAVIGGETFTLHGRLTPLDISEIARAADVDSTSADGAALLADIFRAAFGDHVPAGRKEYQRFRKHLRTVDSADDALLPALGACMEALSGFPTKQQPASPPSRSRSTRGLKASGSRPAAPEPQAHVEEPEDEEPSEPVRQVVVNLGRRAS